MGLQEKQVTNIFRQPLSICRVSKVIVKSFQESGFGLTYRSNSVIVNSIREIKISQLDR